MKKTISIMLVVLLLLATPIVAITSDDGIPKPTEWSNCINGQQSRFTYECTLADIDNDECIEWDKESRELQTRSCGTITSRGSGKSNKYNLDKRDSIEIRVSRGKKSFTYNGKRYKIRYFINILGKPVITFYNKEGWYFPIHPTHLQSNLKKELSELNYIQNVERGRVSIEIYK